MKINEAGLDIILVEQDSCVGGSSLASTDNNKSILKIPLLLPHNPNRIFSSHRPYNSQSAHHIYRQVSRSVPVLPPL